jgi:hypothetical protein
MAIPNEFLCPITMEEMTDPVIGSDGQTYERSAIMRALQSNPKSPMTREPMNVSSLKPNFALKAAIERWKKEQTGASKNKTKTPKTKSRKAQEEPIIVTNSPAYYNAMPAENDIAIAVALQASEIVKEYEEKIKVEQQKTQRMVEEQKRRLQRVCMLVGIVILIFCLIVMFSI